MNKDPNPESSSREASVLPNHDTRIAPNDESLVRDLQDRSREHEEWCRRIIEMASEGVWAVAADGRTMFVNRRMAEMLGYAPDELMSTSPRAVVFEEDLRDFALKEENRRRGVSEVYERRLRRKDGSELWARVSATPVTGAAGEYVGSFAMFTDITERKRAETDLQRRLITERLLARISALSVEAEDVNTFQSDALRFMGETLGVSRVYMFEHRYETDTMDNTFEWVALGVSPQKDNLQGIRTADFLWWVNTLKSGGIINFADIEDIPDEATKEILRPQEIRSLLVIPLFVGGRYYGFMGFDECVRHREWAREDVDLLQAIGRIITSAIERRRAEQTRREMETIVNRSPAVVFLWKAAEGWPVEYVSDNVRQFGYTPEDFCSGRVPFASIIHPDDLERVASEVARYSAEPGREAFVQEYRIVSPDGRVFWLDDRTWIRRNAAGEITHYQGIILDITERKRAEDLLQKTSAKFQTIFEATGTATLLVEADTTILAANKECLSTTGYTPEELIGTKWTQYVAPESLELMLKYHYLRRENPCAAPRRYDVKLINKRGETRDALLDIGMVPGTGQSVVSMLDITDLKRAEEALRRSEAQLSNALQIARAGHWEYDVASDTFTFNDNFYRIFRTTAEEVGGYKMTSAEYARRFCHPEDAYLVAKETRAAIESTDPNYSRQIEHRIRYADGQIGWVAVRFFIVKDARGRTVKTYGVNQDITDRKEAEDKLNQQLDELRRWHKVTLGREERIMELKREVNELAVRLGEKPRYG